ncbi:MAG TPA: lysylphosphatidylglycerol synthase transmembrane domain-containing protein [Ilumatobacteraceae bacterium]|nr:lysylphosphatidylglycerol synthase transmembrane domain-containing protein [Ilumatobacteraceae bacterium]
MNASTDETATGQSVERTSDLVAPTPETADVTDAAPEPASVTTYLFATDAGAPRRRRAPDVWRFVVAGVLLLLLGWAARDETPIDARVVEFFGSTPGWIRTLSWIAYSGAALAALGLVLATLLRGGVKRGVLRDIIVALIIGAGVSMLAARLSTGTWPLFLPEFFDAVGRPAFPTVRVAMVVTIVSAMAPYFTYPIRKFGWWVIGATVVSPFLLGLATLTSVLGALALAAFSVASVRLIFGSPEGLPPVGRLAATLERVGVPTTDLAYLPDQPGTVGLATATGDDGRTLTIKVYGQDAADRQRAERAWKALWYRSSGPAPAAGRVQQVEHEALALLVADRADVRVPAVVEAGQAEGGDVVLVVAEPHGTPIGELDADDGTGVTDESLQELWRALDRLRGVNVAHGNLGARTVRIGDGGPSFVDFEHSSMLPTAQQFGADVASLLGTTAAVVGIEQAVDAALAGYPRRRLVAALPYLQDAVVDPSLRTQMKRSKVKFGQIRSLLVERLGVEEPKLVDVKRVSVQDIVVVFFAIVAVNALISQVAQVGFDTLLEELKTASIGWLIVAFIIKMLGYSTAYMGIKSAVTQPVPYAPTVILQSANSFVGLVVPSTVGKVAMDVRFLQKLGVPTTTAVAQGPVISFFGFLIEIVLLLVTSWALGQAIDTDSLDSQDSGGLLAIVVAVVVIGLIVIAAVPKWRVKVWPKVKEAYESVKGVVSSPVRLGGICLSEFLEKIVGALALAAVVAAFGASVPFTALIFVSVGTGLLAGLAPVPGGIGVAEATMTALLTGVGLPAEQAFSIAVTYRLVTSYLPPVIGFFSLNWMTDKGYI